METASDYGSRAKPFPFSKAEDLCVAEVTMDGAGPKMGQDVQVTIMLQKNSSEQLKVALCSQVAVMYYTGVYKATLRKNKKDNRGELSLLVMWCNRESEV